MTVGIVGLGLIGGSLAKAYKARGHNIYGYDTDSGVLGYAALAGCVDGELCDENLKECHALFLAVYPSDTVDYLEKHARFIAPGSLVLDCCGVKRAVCSRCFPLARRHGFTFVGGHPMAGSHNAGFKHSRANLFRGASMLLVPPVFDNAELFGALEELLTPAEFGHLTFTTAEKHDEMIAFSSQMAHVVSNAYIKSPRARAHKGFSAGSYKDLTRVARLNSDMWAQLCMANGDNLVNELEGFARALHAYTAALKKGDTAALRELLEEGNRLKGETDRP
ncbi:MAG: prephenate dehydrogenase [Oscillospiraceae bacterium]|jgi:prephenate dehydrogenase|nr:prephenate dehydrogenase [Oscillospiraceae bacterium]